MGFPTVAAVALGLAGFAAVARADTLKVPSDDYPTIQSAVDGAVEGDVILVAPGVYAESVNLFEKTGITIKGKGFPTIQPGDDDGIVVLLCEGITISGFEVYQATYGVVIGSSEGVSVSKMVVSGSSIDAFSLAGNAGVLISKCEVNGAAGFGVIDDSSTDLVVEKCSFTEIGNAAVQLSPYNLPGTGSDRAIVSKNRIDESNGGILLGGVDLVAEKNRVTAQSVGIYIEGSTNPVNAVIAKNAVATSSGYGVVVYGGNHRVEGNRLTGGGIYANAYSLVVDRNAVTGAAYGIYMDGSGTTVTRNQVREPTSEGIVLNSYFNAIEGNKVSDGAGRGIVVNFTGGGGPIAGNKVSGCNSHGFHLVGGSNTFTGNSAKNNDGIGFFVNGTGNTLTGNKGSGNGDFDLADTNAEGVNTYTDNKFGTQQIPYVD